MFKRRHFLISYFFGNGHGNFTMSSQEFPSEKEIQKNVLKNKKIEGNIVIMSIYEFKNTKDYLSFREEK